MFFLFWLDHVSYLNCIGAEGRNGANGGILLGHVSRLMLYHLPPKRKYGLWQEVLLVH